MKTKNLLLIMVVILFATFSFTACNKYDDGPSFSPWPAKWRVVNTWKIEKYVVGSVSTNVSNNDTYAFNGNGDYIATSGSIAVNGTWEFGDKKETIKITYGSIVSEAKILRLTSGEMWLSDMNGTTETHYVSAK
jgi:hypothetical protein